MTNPHQNEGLGNLTVFILAGGLGTRLRDVVGDTAKALAAVDDRNFLDLILDKLKDLGAGRAVVLTGYDAESVEGHAQQHATETFAVEFSREPEPLGTAGAIRNAMTFMPAHPFIVINGDTWVDFDPKALLQRHESAEADFTLCVLEEADCSDYGTVRSDDAGRVRAFEEKRPGSGDVNAGVYAVSPSVVRDIEDKRAVSLELEFLPGLLAAGKRVFAHRLKGPMYDIGTPERLNVFRAAVSAGDVQ